MFEHRHPTTLSQCCFIRLAIMKESGNITLLFVMSVDISKLLQHSKDRVLFRFYNLFAGPNFTELK